MVNGITLANGPCCHDGHLKHAGFAMNDGSAQTGTNSAGAVSWREQYMPFAPPKKNRGRKLEMKEKYSLDLTAEDGYFQDYMTAKGYFPNAVVICDGKNTC